MAIGSTALHLHAGGEAAAKKTQLCFDQEWNNCECIGQAVEELGGTLLGQQPYPSALTGLLRQANEPLHLSLAEQELELWPEIPGLGDYQDLLAGATKLRRAKIAVRALSIEQLIRWLQLYGEGEEGARLLARLTLDAKPTFSPSRR